MDCEAARVLMSIGKIGPDGHFLLFGTRHSGAKCVARRVSGCRLVGRFLDKLPRALWSSPAYPARPWRASAFVCPLDVKSLSAGTKKRSWSSCRESVDLVLVVTVGQAADNGSSDLEFAKTADSAPRFCQVF